MESESTYKIQGSRVYGNGLSINCTNKITAQQLQNTLNTYEKTHRLHTNLDTQFDNITKQLIQIKLSIGTLQEEVQRLEKEIQCLSK